MSELDKSSFYVDDEGDVLPSADLGIGKDKGGGTGERGDYMFTKHREAARAAFTGITCGDCLIDLGLGDSCSHLRVGPRGGIYRSDDPKFLNRPKKENNPKLD